jgi:hypothetical protein
MPLSEAVALRDQRRRPNVWHGIEVARPPVDYTPLAVRTDDVLALLGALAEELSANGEIEEWGGVMTAIKEIKEATGRPASEGGDGG